MKITPLTTLLMAILGLALAGAPTTLQAKDNANMTSRSGSKASVTPYSGSIATIHNNTITVKTATTTPPATTKQGKKDGKKVLVLTINGSTKITKGKKKATLADFKVGDQVNGSYTGTSPKIATSLTSSTKKTKGSKTPKNSGAMSSGSSSSSM